MKPYIPRCPNIDKEQWAGGGRDGGKSAAPANICWQTSRFRL